MKSLINFILDVALCIVDNAHKYSNDHNSHYEE